jgi:hypothetical protein
VNRDCDERCVAKEKLTRLDLPLIARESRIRQTTWDEWFGAAAKTTGFVWEIRS